VSIVDRRPPDQSKIARNLIAYNGGVAYVTDPFSVRILAGGRD
jgi:hypothetical protein